MPWWIPLAAAGVNAIGNMIGGHQQNIAARHAADATNAANDEIARRNEALQREFAQNGIRWRVEDAKAAGLHPLAALGAQTSSFSPIQVGSVTSTPDVTAPYRALGEMGQDISRAMASTQTQVEREMAQLQVAAAHTQLEGASLDNQIKQAQLSKLLGGGTTMPSGSDTDNFIPGQGNSPLVRNKPLERVVSAPGRPAQEAGWRPDVSYSRTDTGLSPMVPESLSESLEDDVVGKLMWRIRNQLVPNITGQGSPPKGMLPKGASHWAWSHKTQEWRPAYKSSHDRYMDDFRANLRKKYPGSVVR